MLKIKLVIYFLLLKGLAYSQVFTGYGGAINKNRAKQYFDLNVTGLSSSMSPIFGLMGVNVNINHQYAADLDIFLIAPNNTVIELSTGNGGNGQNYVDCLFNNNSSSKVSNAKAPFKGSFKPEGSLGILNNGSINPNGKWWLMIVDTKPQKDTGYVVNWSLIFSSNPSKIEPFINSNLPLILINTHGKNINDEPRIWSQMHIIGNSNNVNAVSDSAKFFKYGITIEYRGSTSQSFPKKPYGFTTVSKSLADTNVSLLGLPKEHDWILNATYNDKSLMRDVLTHELARRSGRYATRYRYCELFVNGSYEGIYILMEKVKRDKDRVNISKLEPKDTAGNDLTGGYILKIDKTTGNNNGSFNSNGVTFQYDYPNGGVMLSQQKNYIQSFIGKFETALAGSQFQNPTTGSRAYIDVSTFIDYSIMNEISKNVDGYRLSTYLFKDKDSKDGRLKMGPIWDFNLAWNNADYNNSSSPIGWEIDLSGGAPFWWKRFRADTAYVRDFYCRWNQLRQSTLSLYSINKFIDSTYKNLEEASYRNFARWPVMGIYIWPNPSPLSFSMKEEKDSLKKWIQYRCEWIDGEVGVDCKKVKTCTPRVAVYSDKSTICKNESVKLYADGIGNNFQWYPKTGLSSDKGREVMATLSTTSTYKVVMKTKAGCSDSINITINVRPLPDKTISGNTAFCEGNSTQLSVPLGATTYLWSPSTGLDNKNSRTVKANPPFNVNYKIVVTDSLGCKDSNTVFVRFNKKPVIEIKSSRDTVCKNDSCILTASGAYTYLWETAPGLTSGNKAKVTVYPQNSVYTVYGASDMGCLDTASYGVFIYPKSSIGIQTQDSLICYGGTTWLVAKNGSDYTWLKTADFGGSSSGMIQVFPKINTVYKLRGLNKFGCSDSAEQMIKTWPEIQFTLSGKDRICLGDKTDITANGNYAYKWYPLTNAVVIGNDKLQVAPDQSSKYYAIATFIGSLCSDTLGFDVVVNPLPVIEFKSTADTITEGESAVLKFKGAQSYTLKPIADVQFFKDSAIVKPMISTEYTLTGTDSNGCSNSAVLNITVREKVSISAGMKQGIKVYPNPFTHQLYVESDLPVELELTDVHGKRLMKFSQIKLQYIDTTPLPSGVYMIKMQSSAGYSYFKVLKN